MGRLDGWYQFYAGFDPEFSWWAEQPHGELKNELEEYGKVLNKLVTGDEKGADAPLVGDPIGAEALADDLAVEMLAYSPEELLAIGEREFELGMSRTSNGGKYTSLRLNLMVMDEAERNGIFSSLASHPEIRIVI